MRYSTLLLLMLLQGVAMGANNTDTQLALATFAGGCFWCMQSPFEELKGVTQVVSGYTGGQGKEPLYTDYAQKGHVEAIQVTYDSTIVAYESLLETFWRQINPTDAQGQFVDRGPQYRSVIFYHNPDQKKAAIDSKEALARSGIFKEPIVTDILPATDFYLAEGYHQDYHKKNPIKYAYFRFNSGRDQFISKTWKDTHKRPIAAQAFKKPSDKDLRARLTPMQYAVTQQNKTESPFKNEYDKNVRAGIYVDVVSGEPLFSSLDKYDSGTGWPSFTKPLEPKNIVQKEDKGWFSTRTEVRSKLADSHLGHLFTDGPAPTGLRYCMNSAALRFIPVEDLEKEGFGRYLKDFKK